MFRSSHRRCSVRKVVLRNFAKFTGKHLCQSLFFNKAAGWGMCFPVNFCEISTFFKTNFFKEQHWGTTSLCSICILCPGGGCRFPRIVSFRLSKISLSKFFFVNSLFQLVWIKFQAREYVDNNYFTAINVILKSLKVSKLQRKWSFTFTSWIIDFTSICYSWCIGTMDRGCGTGGRKAGLHHFYETFFFYLL